MIFVSERPRERYLKKKIDFKLNKVREFSADVEQSDGILAINARSVINFLSLCEILKIIVMCAERSRIQDTKLFFLVLN